MSNKKQADAPGMITVRMDTEDAMKLIQPVIDEMNSLRKRVLELEQIVIGDGR